MENESLQRIMIAAQFLMSKPSSKEVLLPCRGREANTEPRLTNCRSLQASLFLNRVYSLASTRQAIRNRNTSQSDFHVIRLALLDMSIEIALIRVEHCLYVVGDRNHTFAW